jgi:uncharacterized protein YdhG (YjbR/CyaY superfamily)
MSAWSKYLEELDEVKQKIVVDVLSLAKGFSVDAVEAMPYGVPGLKLNGKPLIAVAAHKAHFGIYPFSPNVIKSTIKLIGDNETAEGTIRFKYGDFPSNELIKSLIDLRSQEININQ